MSAKQTHSHPQIHTDPHRTVWTTVNGGKNKHPSVLHLTYTNVDGIIYIAFMQKTRAA